MRNVISTMAVATALLLASQSAYAHHAFSAEYDIKKPVTLKGAVTKLEWVNPHSWMYVDVKGQDGTIEKWAIEFGSPNGLIRQGLRKSDFPIGTEVTVEGYLAKSGKTVVNGTSVKLPDGKNFYAASSAPGASQ